MTLKLGIIGGGNIFPAYMKTLRSCRRFRLVGLADANPEVAKQRADEHGLTAMSIEELLDSDAAIILNLTPPGAHYAMGKRVLGAGKHFYTEKPLSASYAEGAKLVAYAKEKKLRIGCAPDTFLGQASQTARQLIDEGAVGKILNGTGHFMGHGPDHWHPNPDFFYQRGAGPMLDVGVYYVTHLVNHLGRVREVDALAHMTFKERVIPRGPQAGRVIKVNTPTHIVATLFFAAGARITLTTSFDVWKHGHNNVELYGENGSILVNDPNMFGGKTRYSVQDGPWQNVDYGKPYRKGYFHRGLGLIDMANALQDGGDYRCNERLALHVLEVMDKSLESARVGTALKLETRCERPAPLTERLY
jgi:predicted dehydrogenase